MTTSWIHRCHGSRRSRKEEPWPWQAQLVVVMTLEPQTMTKKTNDEELGYSSFWCSPLQLWKRRKMKTRSRTPPRCGLQFYMFRKQNLKWRQVELVVVVVLEALKKRTIMMMSWSSLWLWNHTWWEINWQRRAKLFIVVALAFATLEEKKQRWWRIELLVVMALCSTSLENNNQENNELIAHCCHGSRRSRKRIHDDDELNMSSLWLWNHRQWHKKSTMRSLTPCRHGFHLCSSRREKKMMTRSWALHCHGPCFCNSKKIKIKMQWKKEVLNRAYLVVPSSLQYHFAPCAHSAPLELLPLFLLCLFKPWSVVNRSHWIWSVGDGEELEYNGGKWATMKEVDGLVGGRVGKEVGWRGR